MAENREKTPLVTRDLHLTAGQARLTLRPCWGGRVLSLSLDGADILYPLQADRGFDPPLWPKGGAYPLIPFHNRIPGGRFSYRGREVRLPLHPQEPAAIHGHAHQRPWQVVKAATEGAVLRFDDDGQGAWPWAFTARQDFTLRPEGLEVALSLTNLSAETMPAGLGWHPFFAKATAITTDAAREWRMGADYLPLGDWHDPRPGAATRYLSDWQEARIATVSGLSLNLRAEALPHLVIHDPDGPYSCIEPVSHLANAMTLHPERAGDRLADLRPGECLTARVTLAF